MSDAKPSDLNEFDDIPMRVTVRIGRLRATLAQLMQLSVGDTLVSTRRVGEPFELLVESNRVAPVSPLASDQTVSVKLLGDERGKS